MKLRYISRNKRRYMSLGKEFPNKDESLNEIEIDDNLAKLLLMERVGNVCPWQEVKAKRVKPEITEEGQ